MTESPEVWRSIPGFEGWYEVSNHGRVRGLDRVITRRNGARYTARGHVLRIGTDHRRRGLRYAKLAHGGRYTAVYPHRLLRDVFGDAT